MNQLLHINRMMWGGAKTILDTDTSLWLKADNPLNTNTRWYDASPNNHVLSGAATLTENVLNSQKGYVFNGSSNYFDGGDILDLGLKSRIIYIISSSSNGSVQPFISKMSTPLNGDWICERYNGGLYTISFCPNQINAGPISTPSSFIKTRHMFDRVNNLQKVKYLGTENTANFSFQNTDFNNSSILYVGKVSQWALLGTICEIIVFDRLLTTDEDTFINAYLNTKYGL